MAGSGTREDPWQLTTANGGSQYQMWRDEAADPPTLVCQVGGTQLKYQLRAIDDLAAWLKEQGDWVPLGGADEQKPAPDGTVEAWGRSESNPVGGWYGHEEGPPRPLRRLPAAAPRDARPRRARAQPEEQPDAGTLTTLRHRSAGQGIL